jgi:hypothetical protein
LPNPSKSGFSTRRKIDRPAAKLSLAWHKTAVPRPFRGWLLQKDKRCGFGRAGKTPGNRERGKARFELAKIAVCTTWERNNRLDGVPSSIFFLQLVQLDGNLARRRAADTYY